MKKQVGRGALFILVPVLLIGIALPILGTIIAPDVPRFVVHNVALCLVVIIVWCVLAGSAWWMQRDESTLTSSHDAVSEPYNRVIIDQSTVKQSPIIGGNNNQVSFGRPPPLKKDVLHEEA